MKKKEHKKLHKEALPEKVSLPKAEHEALLEKAKKGDEYYDKWLRTHADFENTRKRLEKEKMEFLRFANEDLIVELLPIIDNLDRAINSHKDPEKDPHLKGVLLIKDELHKLLERHGVAKIKSVGEKFDPNFHEAMMLVESEKYQEDMVVEELQSGYTMHSKLIRPASVKVSKKKGEN